MKEDTKDKLAKTLVELVQVAAAAAGKYLADAISESMNTAKEIQEEKESEEVENHGEDVV